eukprot:scaffold30046_cov146-Isochrysis_galbana.AAC.3
MVVGAFSCERLEVCERECEWTDLLRSKARRAVSERGHDTRGCSLAVTTPIRGHLGMNRSRGRPSPLAWASHISEQSSKPPHPNMSVGKQVRKVMSEASLPKTPTRKGW